MNIWKVIQNDNNMKRTRRDRDGRVIILSRTTANEHIAIQRESKEKTTLLQSIPDDHVQAILHLLVPPVLAKRCHMEIVQVILQLLPTLLHQTLRLEIGKKEEDSKALITVDTLVDWTDHGGESDGVIAFKEFGMIAGYDTEDTIKE
nr:ribonuclease H-like domain, reverse transcriptase, RNA-dependent DNA polymerase [Tanacetum cinerariifolium]